MKILYGVQATGNGHITRARAMAPALKDAGIEADFLFSGRARDKLFDMEPFGDFDCRTGLTFATRNGRLSTPATLLESRPLRLWRDIRSLRLADYDLILTDYEPITAWGGRRAGLPVVGLGHQYAFNFPVPQHRGSCWQQLVLHNFAPVQKALGVHWYHFDAPILPPIAPIESAGAEIREWVIVVYLPFETPVAITELLRDFDQYRFIAYHPQAPDESSGNVLWRKPGRDTFRYDLVRCGGVICNAGFELASEVLQLGVKILVKPMGGQPEQASNALALERLNLGTAMRQLDRDILAGWLERPQPEKVVYPDVAAAVSHWLADGASADIADLSRELWLETTFPAGFSSMQGSEQCPNSPSMPHRV